MPAPPNSPRVADGVEYAFALLPDADVRVQLAIATERLCRIHRIGGTPVGSNALRMDLCPMGRPERLVQPPEQALLAAGATVSQPEFTLTFDSATPLRSRDGSWPLVLKADAAGTATALELRKAIAAAQAAMGLQVIAVAGFAAWIALMQGDSLNSAEELINPIEWRVREFVLIRRFFGGMRHEVIGRWPLAPPENDGPGDLMAELARMASYQLPADEG